MTKSKTSNENTLPAATAGTAMKVAEPTAQYAGNGGQKPEKLMGRSQDGTAARQQLDGDYIVEQVTKNVSTSNQALYEKFSDELRQQNKEFNQAIQTQNKEFNEAMRQQNKEFNEAMQQQNDKFNDKINQVHRDININNRWLIGGLMALVIAVLLT